MEYPDKYLPVDPDFSDRVVKFCNEGLNGKIHFFNEQKEIDDAIGTVLQIQNSKNGEYLLLNTEKRIRLDKIITIFGKPGPSYEAYDRYANVCFTCENLNQI